MTNGLSSVRIISVLARVREEGSEPSIDTALFPAVVKAIGDMRPGSHAQIFRDPF
jgi:hypothetical protein